MNGKIDRRKPDGQPMTDASKSRRPEEGRRYSAKNADGGWIKLESRSKPRGREIENSCSNGRLRLCRLQDGLVRDWSKSREALLDEFDFRRCHLFVHFLLLSALHHHAARL